MEIPIIYYRHILLLLLLLLLLLSTPSLSQLNNFFYPGFDPKTTNLTLNGVAEIQSNKIIRLTNTKRRLIGHAFYKFPLRFKDGSINNSAFSFSTAFVFAIVPATSKFGGHGFAFTIAPTTELRGAFPSQFLGLLDSSRNRSLSDNNTFAVEFDTVKNVEFDDIDDNHIGVDINSLKSRASVSAADINLQSGSKIQAWVDYDGDKKLINVSLSLSSSKPISPILSSPLDLSPILRDYMYVGFSASTGLLASSHYVLGWSFRMNGEARSFDLSSLPSIHQKHHKKNRFLIAGAGAGLLLGCVILAAICFLKRRKEVEELQAWEPDYGPHRFSYRVLKLATKDFRTSELLGFGGSGRVYRGTLPGITTQIAVKRISHESKRGLREFVTELGTTGRLRHRNLIQLQGWCQRRTDLLLVYDFMCNGSLDKYLFDRPKSILGWEQRFKVVRDVAAALLYLHEEWDQVVIHRDVKAGNVLLDADMNGKLGDFGLARLHEHGSKPLTTQVVGTLGYLAPELTRTGKATTSSDVFAFGALLLEVACGRRPVEPKALPEEMILVDWVWEKWRAGRILDAVDPKLDRVFDKEEAELVLKLGLLCSNSATGVRPRMRDVVRYLDGEAVLQDIPIMAPIDSESFGDFVSPSEKEGIPAAAAAAAAADRLSSVRLCPFIRPTRSDPLILRESGIF